MKDSLVAVSVGTTTSTDDLTNVRCIVDRGTAGRRYKVALISTGGTVAKTYDCRTGGLSISVDILSEIVGTLRMDDADVQIQELVHKDSLDIDEVDRNLIVEAVQTALPESDTVIVSHGTDTLTVTAEAVYAAVGEPTVPIIFTGAMVPHVVRGSDSCQNLTEAFFAARLLAPGVYVVAHNRVLPIPGVVKDFEAMTFVSTIRSGDLDGDE